MTGRVMLVLLLTFVISVTVTTLITWTTTPPDQPEDWTG